MEQPNVNTYVARVTAAIGYLSLIINSTTVIVGTIGGICNLITFTAPVVRFNASVFYLLCASVFQIFSIVFGIPTRMALDSFGSNLERQSLVFCKMRYYLTLTGPQLVTYYVLLAIVDRFLATSNNAGTRAWSDIKFARRVSLMVFIVTCTTTTHFIVFYRIVNGTCQVPPNSGYTIFFAIYLILIVSVVPYLLMLLFSLLTVLNLRQRQRRILPIVHQLSSRRAKRFETQLFTIIAIQVIVTCVLALLRVGSYTYSTMTSSHPDKTASERAAEGFTIRLGIALYYFSFAISFYVSTLTSAYFRQIFLKRVKRFLRRTR